MRKTMEQIVLEGQAAKCESLEELYLLWQMMQQMEEEPYGVTCYGDVDQRTFHIDGVVSYDDYNGTMYILKETNMRKYVQKGQTMPVISDIRQQLAAAKSPTGEVEYMDYLAGMQKILNEESAEKNGRMSMQKLLKQSAVVYINNLHFFVLVNACGIEQIFINRYTAYVVKFRLNNSCSVNFSF